MYPQITLTHARDNLDKLCEQVIDDREVVIITQPTGENVALIAADELSSLMETVHLLKSPQNAIRLLTELQDAKERVLKSQSIDELRQELELNEKGSF